MLKKTDKKKLKKPSPLDPQLKYKLYEKSVQNSPADIDFINSEYKRLRGKKPITLREDFGGTAQLACLWTKQSSAHKSWAIDLDPEPVAYGKEHHYSKLSDDEKKRMSYVMGNVLDKQDFSTDVLCAFNFSYFIFKERKQLLKYFKRARKSLTNDGVFFLDIFGGTESYDPLVEETDHGKFSYFWDLDSYNPLSNEVQYYIHFKVHKDKVKYEQAFSYDWRMWTVREIVELLEEAGFSEVKTYWEEDGEDDEGNGVFYESQVEENCESWVTYITALK